MAIIYSCNWPHVPEAKTLTALHAVTGVPRSSGETLPQRRLWKELALVRGQRCLPGPQGSPSGPWGLRGAGPKPEKRQEEAGASGGSSLVGTGRPGSPCREDLGNHTHSFKIHFLYVRSSTRNHRRHEGKQTGTPTMTMGMNPDGQAAPVHSRPGQSFDTEGAGDLHFRGDTCTGLRAGGAVLRDRGTG